MIGQRVSRRRRSWGCLSTVLLISIGAGRASAAGIDDLIERTSRQTAGLVDVISKVNCLEVVTQTRLSPDGRVVDQAVSTFDYLALFDSAGGDLSLSESRLSVPAVGRTPRQPTAPMLLSNGLSLLFLVFHPRYVSAFDFKDAGTDIVGGTRVAVVRFEHVRGARSPAALLVKGREYELELEGTASIEASSGAVVRMQVGLASGMEDIGLVGMDADIRFAPVSLQSPTMRIWLPANVTVDVRSRRQHWRNEHRFTRYRRFAVETNERMERK